MGGELVAGLGGCLGVLGPANGFPGSPQLGRSQPRRSS